MPRRIPRGCPPITSSCSNAGARGSSSAAPNTDDILTRSPPEPSPLQTLASAAYASRSRRTSSLHIRKVGRRFSQAGVEDVAHYRHPAPARHAGGCSPSAPRSPACCSPHASDQPRSPSPSWPASAPRCPETAPPPTPNEPFPACTSTCTYVVSPSPSQSPSRYNSSL